jgi:hypothetical protein
MTHHWDEFSKSLAEKSVPRRESLRLLGAALAGAILSPLAMGTAWAGGRDPCQAFCRCRNKTQQNACLAACNACGKDTNRLCGTCGSYACTDLANDFYNCGACGYVCDEPGPYEDGACVDGHCFYSCVEGAADCDGAACTPLWADPDNCGACGNVCPESAPYCNQGVCSSESPCSPPYPTLCGDVCVNLSTDYFNCGACGNVCYGFDYCAAGVCESSYPPGWEW